MQNKINPNGAVATRADGDNATPLELRKTMERVSQGSARRPTLG